MRRERSLRAQRPPCGLGLPDVRAQTEWGAGEKGPICKCRIEFYLERACFSTLETCLKILTNNTKILAVA